MIREQKGQSIVEFALLLPVLLLILCGVFDLGRLMYAYISLNMTAQEAVRMGGLGKSDSDIATYAKNHIQVGDASVLQVTIVPTEANRKSGDDVTVKLSYSLPFVTPLITEIIPAPTVAANSTIRVE